MYFRVASLTIAFKSKINHGEITEGDCPVVEEEEEEEEEEVSE